VDYFYSAAEHRLRGALWPSFAPARICSLWGLQRQSKRAVTRSRDCFVQTPELQFVVSKTSGASPASQTSLDCEPFVDADVVASFLSLERRLVLDWARSGDIPGHPLGRGRRRTWRFRLSEVAELILSNKKPTQCRILPGSPQVARKRGGYANG
jgi:hypothetical protein